MEYNTERPLLTIPEYGRHIQKLVQQAIHIQDPSERNNMAKAIISIMGNFNPHLRDVPLFQYKLWDQLFIMSDFNLKVDSPFNIPTRESVRNKPQKLNYPQKHPKYRFYGSNILNIINTCVQWEEGELKEILKISIANYMKKCFLAWNKDAVEDGVILDHLRELSNGYIDLKTLNDETFVSKEFQKTKNNKRVNKNNFPKT